MFSFVFIHLALELNIYLNTTSCDLFKYTYFSVYMIKKKFHLGNNNKKECAKRTKLNSRALAQHDSAQVTLVIWQTDDYDHVLIFIHKMHFLMD